MNKGMKVICLVGAGMIAFGMMLAGVCYLLGVDTDFGYTPWDRYRGRGMVNEADMERGSETLTVFQGIDMDVNYQEVEIREGKEFGIEYAYNRKFSTFSYEVRDGILYVEERQIKGSGDLWKEVNQSHLQEHVTITCPPGTALDSVVVNANMGAVDLEDLDIASLNVDANMGSVEFDSVTCAKVVIDCDMGSVEADNLKCTEYFDVTASMGSVEISGDLRGKTVIDCVMGGVELNLEGERSDYSWDTDVSLGSVEIDGDELRGDRRSGGSGENLLDITASMGSVDLSFDN